MNALNRKPLFLGLIGGIALTITSAVLMGQGASTPVKSDTQYFVTGEGDDAHLWVREGTSLRCVGHGACKAHDHDHKHSEDDGHYHGMEKK